METPDGLYHMSLLYKTNGWNSRDSLILHISSWMMGKGSEFMDGGPGRGMHSRNCLCKLLSYLSDWNPPRSDSPRGLREHAQKRWTLGDVFPDPSLTVYPGFLPHSLPDSVLQEHHIRGRVYQGQELPDYPDYGPT